jgi:two-component system cell cycle response regulator CtrA
MRSDRPAALDLRACPPAQCLLRAANDSDPQPASIEMEVLLVEDEPTTARSIELMLGTEGFNVNTTDLGEEGLDLGKLYDYDIILLDLNLPDMHGYDVLKKLRTAKVSTPVLILSGIGEMDSKRVAVTGREFAILELLALRLGNTITKEMLLNHLYGGRDEAHIKIIDVFVCKLRNKLSAASGGVRYIETVWGRGYALAPDQGSADT